MTHYIFRRCSDVKEQSSVLLWISGSRWHWMRTNHAL